MNNARNNHKETNISNPEKTDIIAMLAACIRNSKQRTDT